MSTFDGFIREFPDIQVDYFRSTSATAARRPLACFLSHVHSDHLVGLDTLRSPFVYCSAATRALVLGLEKYPCQVNFARGILEARKRTYKDLKHLLKPLPLETPTVIELAPGNRVQVTLLDANHCPGSVMFLFENDRRAALYTGDTRLEPWFVDALVHSPCLAEYTSGLRTLDTVYLDTTFLDRTVAFQTKADGLRELLQSVSKYPADTVFHFRAWTFGYEQVWTALAKALQSKVHVGSYKIGLYESLTVKDSTRRFGTQVHLDPVAPGLVGFMRANTAHDGCLVAGHDYDAGTARIHSCDRDVDRCPVLRDPSVVWIRPVVCRLPRGGGEWPEVGAGGGAEDLNKDAELEISGADDVDRLCRLVEKNSALSPAAKSDLQTLLAASLQNSRHLPLHMDLAVDSQDTDDDCEQTAVSKKIEDAVCDMARWRADEAEAAEKERGRVEGDDQLPRTITFPYSRHSSYQEQCDLLGKLRPKDVWPCTVNPDRWFYNGETVTVKDLFGQYCSGAVFRHDDEVASRHRSQQRPVEIQDSQATTDSDMATEPSLPDMQHPGQVGDEDLCTLAGRAADHHVAPASDYPYFYYSPSLTAYAQTSREDNDDGAGEDSQATAVSELSREKRLGSHHAAVHNAVDSGEWLPIGLISTTDNHTTSETDLGGGTRVI